MLNQPTPYPEVGSYALLERDGRTHLARIQQRKGDKLLISLPLVRDVASGNATVAPGDLIDGTPLTEGEREEMLALAERALRVQRPRGDWPHHLAALRSRDLASRQLEALMDRLPNPARRVSMGEAA